MSLVSINVIFYTEKPKGQTGRRKQKDQYKQIKNFPGHQIYWKMRLERWFIYSNIKTLTKSEMT